MTALKKSIHCPVVDKKEKERTLNILAPHANDKEEVEKYKKLISEKIKDPTIAKKAALILSEMLLK